MTDQDEGSWEGTAFGQYRLVSLLGVGGMGEVWRAYDTATDRVVALKVLPAHLAGDGAFEKRFRREARSAAGLSEPHVVPIHSYGEIDGRLYVDMRLIEGEDLEAMLGDGPLDPARAVMIVEQIALALNAAHQVGLIHRDVKPSNILVTATDFAYLIDFGVARTAGETGLTGRGSMVGTWAYMAPERFGAGDITPRSDVYALACVLHQALTGERPFPGDSMERQILGHLSTPPPQPSALNSGVPSAIDEVIARGMAKSPDERFPTTVEFARAAQAAITTPAGPLSSSTSSSALGSIPPSAPASRRLVGPADPPQHRRRRFVLAGAGALIMVIAVVLAIVWPRNHDAGPLSSTAGSTSAATGNSGPLNGRYKLDFARGTDPSGRTPDFTEPAASAIWDIRSVCRSSGCVATATVTGGPTLQPTYVLDALGGQWLGVSTVTLASQPPSRSEAEAQTGGRLPCAFPAEFWEVISLRPQADGTFAGEYIASGKRGCSVQRVVTAARIGDTEVASLPNPEDQPPRVVSPAEALKGRYRHTLTVTSPVRIANPPRDFTAATWCLRTGARCVTRFYNADDIEPLIYSDGKWSLPGVEFNGTSQNCADTTTHYTITGEYSTPQPMQDPIVLMTGHETQVTTQSDCDNGTYEFEGTYTRIGD